MFGLTIWQDEYLCDSCEQGWDRSVELPGLPWGEHYDTADASAVVPDGGTTVYSGVRHPNFRETPEGTPEVPEGDGHCRACGGYAHSGLLCDSCRGEGWTDAYGLIDEPDEDGREDDDEDGWPEDFDGGYGPSSYFAHAMSKDD